MPSPRPHALFPVLGTHRMAPFEVSAERALP